MRGPLRVTSDEGERIDRRAGLGRPRSASTTVPGDAGEALPAETHAADPRQRDQPEPTRVDREPERAAALATISLIGLGLNATALILAPLLRPDVNLLRDGLSHYAVGPWGGVQAAAFVALGIGALTLAGALWLVAADVRWLRIAAVMLGLAAVNFVGLAVFPMGEGGPMTPIGDLHLTVATFAVGWQFVSVSALLRGLRAWPHTASLIQRGIALAGITLLGAAAVQVALWRPDLKIPEGLAMRVVIVPLLLWWTLVALTIRRRAAG